MLGAALSVKLVSPCRGSFLAETTTPAARKHKMYCARDNKSPVMRVSSKFRADPSCGRLKTRAGETLATVLASGPASCKCKTNPWQMSGIDDYHPLYADRSLKILHLLNIYYTANTLIPVGKHPHNMNEFLYLCLHCKDFILVSLYFIL